MNEEGFETPDQKPEENIERKDEKIIENFALSIQRYFQFLNPDVPDLSLDISKLRQTLSQAETYSESLIESGEVKAAMLLNKFIGQAELFLQIAEENKIGQKRGILGGGGMKNRDVLVGIIKSELEIIEKFLKEIDHLD